MSHRFSAAAADPLGAPLPHNLTDEDPIASDANFPVGFMGRQFFLGLNVRL